MSRRRYHTPVACEKRLSHCDWSQHFELKTMTPPGLPDIKWNELYAKWGRFIPEERKQGLWFYCNKPPPSVKKKIEEHAKEAREQRKRRTRAGGNDTLKPMGRKLKAEEKKSLTKAKAKAKAKGKATMARRNQRKLLPRWRRRHHRKSHHQKSKRQRNCLKRNQLKGRLLHNLDSIRIA